MFWKYLKAIFKFLPLLGDIFIKDFIYRYNYDACDSDIIGILESNW